MAVSLVGAETGKVHWRTNSVSKRSRSSASSLRKIAMWKMEGYTNEEIAEMLPCSRATVARKLAIIRKIWRSELTA